MTRSVWLVLLSAALVACGGDDDDDETGGVGGGGAGNQVSAGPHTFVVRDSAAFAGTTTCNQFGFEASTSFVAVTVSDAANVCSLLEADQQPANASALTVLVQRSNAFGRPAPAVTARSYTVTPLDELVPEDNSSGNVLGVIVAIVRNDATCNDVSGDGAFARSGTVRLDAVEASRIRGAVDVTFEDGTRVAANFDAPVCSGLDAASICDVAPPTGCRQ